MLPVTMRAMTVTLPAELHRQTKAVAAIQGTTLSEIVRGALEEYVSVALEEDPVVKTILQIEANLKAGTEKIFTWDEVMTDLKRMEAEENTAR
jgi:predicted transcriptional regulator